MDEIIVVTNWVHEDVTNWLAQSGRVIANSGREPWSRPDLLRRARDATALMTFMTDRIDEDFLVQCPRLRVIACALKGYDNFDVDACTRRGIRVTIAQDLLTEPTAELAVGLMIAVARNILPGDRFIRSGRFHGWRPRFYGQGIAGRVVGLLGVGAIGKAVAARLKGFRATVVYHDREPLSLETEKQLEVQRRPLAQLLAESDFIVLALPLTGETQHIINGASLACIKPGAYLINPGRGSLVHEEAVAEALDRGHLSGYAADVFEMEDWAREDAPNAIAPRLIEEDRRTVLTPHLGSAVDDVRRCIALEAAEQIIAVLKGREPRAAVNAAALRRPETASGH